MSQLFSDSYLTYLIIFIAGVVAYIISTLSGGGGSLLLVPVINFLIGGKATAPVINLGNLIGEPARIILFWKSIEWKIVKYYLPSAIAGAVLGAWIFSNIQLEWLQIIIGLFLVSTIVQYRFGKKERSFRMKLSWFLPVSFLVTFFSTLIGAVGPVLNPFYLNYGLEKEKMIATKTVNSFFVGLVQISGYTALGYLKGELWLYGLILGLGATLGNWIGKRFLQKITSKVFRVFVLIIMVTTGLVLIIEQLIKRFS
jgi:uncharacterized membrane protein YfcA